MKNLLRSSLAIAVGLSLAACGSSSSDSTSALEFSGSGIKGTLQSATVELSRAGSSEVLATTQTDASGKYSFELADATGGAFVVTIKADADTKMICDSTPTKCAAAGAVDDGNGVFITEGDKLTGLEISTIAYNSGATAVVANANALTTLATNTVLAAAASNANLDLSTVDASVLATLKQDASDVVAAILGVTLASGSIYDINIVDASVAADVVTDDATTATLTLINAALSGLTLSGTDTIGDTIASYFAAVKSVTTDVLAGDSANLADITILGDIQADLSAGVADIKAVIELETKVSLDLDTVPTSIDEQAIVDTVGDIIIPTGATGGTTTGGTGN